MNKRALAGYIAIGVALLCLLSFHGKGGRKEEMRLELHSEESGVCEWLPGLSLAKGNYQLLLIAANDGSGIENEVEICSDDSGVIRLGSISSNDYSTSYPLELSNASNIVYVRTLSDEDGTKVNLTGMVIEPVQGTLYSDAWWFLGIFTLLYVLLGVYLFNEKLNRERAWTALALFAAVIIVSAPLYKPYLTVGHDIRFHLYRIEGIKDALLSGQLPVRLHPTFNHGYGYGTATLYPELFLYIPALLRIMGMSIPMAYQTFCFLINLGTAFLVFYSVKSVTKSRYASLASALLYTFSLYRLVCLYERAALGEVLGLCFIPLVIAGLYHVILGDQKKWRLLMVGCTLVFQPHMISTVLTALLGVILGILYFPRLWKERRFLSLGKALLGTALLSMWYLIPLLDFYRLDLRMHFVKSFTFFQNAVYVPQLLEGLGRGTGLSYDLPGGQLGEMTMTVGLLVWLCVFVCGGIYLIDKKQKKGYGFALFLIGLFSMFAATTWFPWEQLEQYGIVKKIVSVLQFPWRLLGYSSLLLVISTGFLLAENEHRIPGKWRCGLLVIAVMIGMYGVTQYNMTMDNQGIFLAKSAAIPTAGANGATEEYLLDGHDFTRCIPDQYIASDRKLQITERQKSGTNVFFVYENAADGSWVEVPLLWYPGYRAVDEEGNVLKLSRGDGNYLRVYLNQSHGEVYLSYGSRKVYRAAEAVTLLALAAFVGYTIREKRGKYRREKESHAKQSK